MILTVDEYRQFDPLPGEPDFLIASKLKAIEQIVRSYTNNRFTVKDMNVYADIRGSVFISEELIPFQPGDTVLVTGSRMNNGLYTVREADDNTFCVEESTEGLHDAGTVTKVRYPEAIRMGVVNMMKWEFRQREKMGIQSEKISRHEVTYADPNNIHQSFGYPDYLTSFMEPFRKARFGGGVAE